jgi:pyrroline-5-carboxylate reductase
MTLGFLGTGAITAAIVTGLNAERADHLIRLSPRNPDLAATLAARFETVSVCASNQDVLDSSDTVVLAVRPQVAEEVLSELRFSSTHTVISLIAGFSTTRIAELVTPADRVSRAIPLPSVARRRGPVAVYPAASPAAELFAPLGQVFGMESEDHLNALSTATSTMASYFSFLGHIAAWTAKKGIPESQAREYVGLLFAGLNDAGMEASGRTFEDLATAHATPGGLNEQVVRDLTEHGVFDTLRQALDSVHRRAAGVY